MKLRDLVALRNTLRESIALESLRQEADLLLQRIISIPNVASSINSEYVDQINSIAGYYRNIASMLDHPPAELLNLERDITAEIIDRTKTFNKRGYLINGLVATNTSDVVGERNERVQPMISETVEMIKSRIELYSDWRYPGLEIGPGDGHWTKFLVANDPLYIIDIYPEFLNSTKSQFTPEYQARLCAYHFDQFDNTPYQKLPLGQFGFVFAWNVFTFYPYVETLVYFKEIFNVMRPGGVFLFSYNNCDRPENASYAEEGWMSWMPRTQMEQLVTHIGFEIIGFYDAESNFSWAEVKKPGAKQTAKSHQVLGEIKHRTH